MNIDQIKGSGYSPKKTQKSDSSSKTSSVKNNAAGSKATAGSSPKAASVSLSGSTFESEMAFTKSILANARQESFSSLKGIKQKINAGAYNDEAVHQEIGAVIKKDLSSIQDLLSQSPTEEALPGTISTEHKRNLLENPRVTQKVADKIAEQLKKI